MSKRRKKRKNGRKIRRVGLEKEREKEKKIKAEKERKKIRRFKKLNFKSFPDFQEAVDEYCKLRKEQGDKAKSSRWLINNGHGKIYFIGTTKYGLKWDYFKKQAGFLDKKPLRVLIKEYKVLYREHGDLVLKLDWMRKNGHSEIPNYLSHYKITWEQFKESAGFSKKKSLKSLIRQFNKLRKEHGDKAKSCNWLCRNGFRDIHSQVYNRHRLKWYDFIKLCEGHFEMDEEDLMI
jgi:hypothetical protein